MEPLGGLPWPDWWFASEDPVCTSWVQWNVGTAAPQAHEYQTWEVPQMSRSVWITFPVPFYCSTLWFGVMVT